jgi:hypothetical protein
MKTLILILLLSTAMFAQIKIGDITIPESTAKEYFLYCYKHPDTTWFYQYSDSKIEIEKQRIRDEQRKKELAKRLSKVKTHADSIKTFWGMWGSQIDTAMRLIDNREWNLARNNIGCVNKSKKVNEDITEHYTGYLTKHKPTALDFSRWYIGVK